MPSLVPVRSVIASWTHSLNRHTSGGMRMDSPVMGNQKWESIMHTSRRHEPLPRGWYKTRLRILKRDGYRCTWVRQDSTGGRCPEKANQVDHVNPLGGEGDDNLTSLCAYHHKIKSSSEGGRAVHKSQGKQMKKHPGMYRVMYALTHVSSGDLTDALVALSASKISFMRVCVISYARLRTDAHNAF